MVKETVISAKTIEAAVEQGAAELGTDLASVEFEVLEQPSKGFLGIGASNAKVRVYIQVTPASKAVAFMETVLVDMGLTAQVSVKEEKEDEATLVVSGKGLGSLIGRHGDVLDSLQYLASLAANRVYDGFYRITLDVEGYREKREETLRRRAQKQAEKVLKFKRSFALEPMNPYERRIIHTEIQKIAGVATYSIGQDTERRIVICLEGKEKNRK
ncbi:MAG: protein jag [Clostridia bacterium]|nr:protein jag [Clostridia bacterium]